MLLVFIDVNSYRYFMSSGLLCDYICPLDKNIIGIDIQFFNSDILINNNFDH